MISLNGEYNLFREMIAGDIGDKCQDDNHTYRETDRQTHTHTHTQTTRYQSKDIESQHGVGTTVHTTVNTVHTTVNAVHWPQDQGVKCK